MWPAELPVEERPASADPTRYSQWPQCAWYSYVKLLHDATMSGLGKYESSPVFMPCGCAIVQQLLHIEFPSVKL